MTEMYNLNNNESMSVHVKGISHYQGAARHCRAGDTVDLVPEPHNPYDNSAVRVDCRGGKIGYLPCELASSLVLKVRAGRVSASVSNVVGSGTMGYNLGVVLNIRIEAGSSGGTGKHESRPNSPFVSGTNSKLRQWIRGKM